jgi:phenylacetate-CoA ligase
MTLAEMQAGKAFLQDQLAQTQWWSERELVRHQFNQIKILADHARRTIPFWQERFLDAGITPQRTLDSDSWRQLPVLTRRELQKAGEDILSEDVPETHGEFIDVVTSGSTGTPVRVIGTELDAYYFKAFILREHLWHRRDFAGKFATIRRLENQTKQHPERVFSRWGDEATFPFPTGPAVALNISASTRKQAEWLQHHDPDYLSTYPSNLSALARHFRQHGLKLPHLKQVLTTGEVLPDYVRMECREIFGVEIADTYSTMEVGAIAFQCSEQGKLHVQAEHCYVEIIDEDDRPCLPGTVGRVIVTQLHNFAMPLLRYEIGDYAEAGAECPCGRGLPALNKVLGRVRNMFVFSNGEQYFPSFGAATFRTVAPVIQHQFIQTATDAIVVRLVVERSLTDVEESGVRQHILQRLPLAMQIKIEFVDDIPRGESGKYEEFISLVSTPVR